jgi:hypothetical protein
MHPTPTGGSLELRGTFDVTEARPSACRHVGLDCSSCVNACASKVAGLCAHLTEDQQQRMFFRLYPDAVCRHNVGRFQSAYERHTRLEQGDAVKYELECAVA